jgi:signal transduction histidine kinase
MNRMMTSWAVFTGALFLVLTVMLFFTFKVLDYERAWAQVEQRVALEENVRLALWRMDSAAAALANEALVKAPGKVPSQPVAKQNEAQQRQGPAQNSQIPQGDQNVPQAKNSYQTYAIQQRGGRDNQEQMSQTDYGYRATLNTANTLTLDGDWKKYAPQLLEKIKDIFPEAKLMPAKEPEVAGKVDSRRLASIPAVLVIKEDSLPALTLAWNTPVRVSLMVAWACAGCAALAVGLLLKGVLDLSERRAAFVSTVTHELRTPLTTFRMYSEMLADGMVQTPEAQKHYLATLVTEADRLGHLIENVLAYARLERQLSPKEARTLGVKELLDRSIPGLERRTAKGGYKLHVEIPQEAQGLSCRIDTIAVHQVLLNLVDNACKYGQSDVTLKANVSGKNLEIAVSDTGPGMEQAQVDRLFSAFSKLRDDAVPGIGLGLYLSRRLARQLGGDLALEQQSRGACFVFSIPLAQER